jgi:hypothetical protein
MGVVLIFRNISEKRLAENRLVKQSAELRQTVHLLEGVACFVRDLPIQVPQAHSWMRKCCEGLARAARDWPERTKKSGVILHAKGNTLARPGYGRGGLFLLPALPKGQYVSTTTSFRLTTNPETHLCAGAAR